MFLERIDLLETSSGNVVYPRQANVHLQIEFDAQMAHVFHVPENDNRK
jgi:hypothetical protein